MMARYLTHASPTAPEYIASFNQFREAFGPWLIVFTFLPALGILLWQRKGGTDDLIVPPTIPPPTPAIRPRKMLP
jgi:hypothetical protein